MEEPCGCYRQGFTRGYWTAVAALAAMKCAQLVYNQLKGSTS
jgi:hypothetical protein